MKPITMDYAIPKRYSTISEMADELKVHVSAIRYWCNEFHLEIKRNRHKDRMFTEQNKIQIREIYFLLYTEGFTLKGAKRKLENL